MKLWGTGSPMREFLHSNDLANACIHLMENYNNSDIVNIGTGVDITIKKLAETIKEITGYQGNLIWDTEQPDGTPRKLLDVGRLHSLGWKHKINLRKGIQDTYEWYLKKLKTKGGKLKTTT